jgi:hypothetical protein
MMACSWGAFQELGENYDDCGFASVGAFVDRMKSGLPGQLEIFVRSIRKRGLVDELLRHDWAGFARNYNGPNYRAGRYDEKMAAAYKLFRARRIDWDRVLAPPASFANLEEHEVDHLIHGIGPFDAGSADAFTDLSTLDSPPHFPADDLPPAPWAAAEETTGLESSPPGSNPQDAGTSDEQGPGGCLTVEDWKPFVLRWLRRVWGMFTGGNFAQGTGLFSMAVTDEQRWYVYLAVGAVVFIILSGAAAAVSAVLLAIWYFNRREINAAKMEQARSVIDPNRRNLQLFVEKK